MHHGTRHLRLGSPEPSLPGCSTYIHVYRCPRGYKLLDYLPHVPIFSRFIYRTTSRCSWNSDCSVGGSFGIIRLDTMDDKKCGHTKVEKGDPSHGQCCTLFSRLEGLRNDSFKQNLWLSKCKGYGGRFLGSYTCLCHGRRLARQFSLVSMGEGFQYCEGMCSVTQFICRMACGPK